MTIPNEVGAKENLGRGIFSSSRRDRARRGNIPFHTFLERPGKQEISVDRLDHAPEIEAIKIASDVAAARNAKFDGWAVVVTKLVCTNGRIVNATPRGDNPYHADIVLPPPADQDREEQKQHAKDLADMAEWREPNL